MSDKHTSGDYQNAVRQMVKNEVLCCVSHLVSTLAANMADGCASRELQSLIEQAGELSYPVYDWEEAAIQEGWKLSRLNGTQPIHSSLGMARDWQAACELSGIDPHEREIFEHWAVSDWLANKLEARGERVDRDFAGLIVWARTTTGQAILLDRVVCEIYDATQSST